MICELILSYPHKYLNPNARKHWREKSEAAKVYRRECFYAAKQAGWFGIEFTPRVHLWIDFYPPDKRARDDDNVFAAFKSGRDGIAEALGIDDKRFVSHPMLHPFDPNFQGVKVRMQGELRDLNQDREILMINAAKIRAAAGTKTQDIILMKLRDHEAAMQFKREVADIAGTEAVTCDEIRDALKAKVDQLTIQAKGVSEYRAAWAKLKGMLE